MSYPEYPENRLIVNNVDLSEKFGMILVDGYNMPPPSIKTYSVDIPCGDGKLDLTEALRGRTTYDNRSMEFQFCILNATNIEETKKRINEFLHGKAYDFMVTMDPDYTYHGRFTISNCVYGVYDVGKVLSMKITVDAEPYKKRPESYSFSAVGGILYTLSNGLKLVTPTIISGGNLKVIINNRTVYINSKEWKSDLIRLNEGDNELYFNSYEIHNLTWGDITTKNITWEQFKKKRLFEWYKSVGTIDHSLAEKVNVYYDWSGI